MAQAALSFEPGPFPGLPRPAVGPKGPKIGQKSGAGFIILSSLRFAKELSYAGTLARLVVIISLSLGFRLVPASGPGVVHVHSRRVRMLDADAGNQSENPTTKV